jgi:hypothetical protein
MILAATGDDVMTADDATPKDDAVQTLQPGKPLGERQDGAGSGPDRPERNDAVPAGSTAARRAGIGRPRMAPDEADAGHRGQPAGFQTGAATGSGSGAGGGGTGLIEEPDSDSAGGGGHERGFAASRAGHRGGRKQRDG